MDKDKIFRKTAYISHSLRKCKITSIYEFKGKMTIAMVDNQLHVRLKNKDISIIKFHKKHGT